MPQAPAARSVTFQVNMRPGNMNICEREDHVRVVLGVCLCLCVVLGACVCVCVVCPLVMCVLGGVMCGV
jgi:hypothetical protein